MFSLSLCLIDRQDTLLYCYYYITVHKYSSEVFECYHVLLLCTYTLLHVGRYFLLQDVYLTRKIIGSIVSENIIMNV